MYNLTVATAHTFFVGDGSWLVHNTCRGGRYKNLIVSATEQRHYVPAAAITPYPYRDAPAIVMDTVDHQKTASWGSSNAARAYRVRQQQLIQQGRLDDAIQMDIDDIRSKFGSKYDDAIAILNHL